LSHRSGELLQAAACLGLSIAALVRPIMTAREARARMLERYGMFGGRASDCTSAQMGITILRTAHDAVRDSRLLVHWIKKGKGNDGKTKTQSRERTSTVRSSQLNQWWPEGRRLSLHPPQTQRKRFHQPETGTGLALNLYGSWYGAYSAPLGWVAGLRLSFQNSCAGLADAIFEDK
jgi:hypothetical protein